MLYSCSNTKLKFSTFRKYPNSTWVKIAPHKLYILTFHDLLMQIFIFTETGWRNSRFMYIEAIPGDVKICFHTWQAKLVGKTSPGTGRQFVVWHLDQNGVYWHGIIFFCTSGIKDSVSQRAARRVEKQNLQCHESDMFLDPNSGSVISVDPVVKWNHGSMIPVDL